MVSRASQPLDDDDVTHTVTLHGVTWSDYERVLAMRGDKAAPRISYLDGELEIMSPSRSHESIKSLMACLLEVWFLEREITFDKVGSWTRKEAPREAGVEPDECYVFGDLARERPDLAIEVVWRGRGIALKEGAYHRLGVRELWVWKDGSLQVRARGPRAYRNIKTSAVLPDLDLAQLAPFLDVTPTSAAIRAYRAALRSNQ